MVKGVSKTKIAVVSLAAIVTGFILFLYHYAVSSKYMISGKEAKQLIQNKQIDLVIDVRTSIERNTLGHYPGSLHIQSNELEKVLASKYPNKNLRILLYCNTGHRARIQTEKLHDLGYTNTVYIPGTYRSLI